MKISYFLIVFVVLLLCTNSLLFSQSYLLKNEEKGTFFHGGYALSPYNSLTAGLDLCWQKFYLSGSYNFDGKIFGVGASYLLVRKMNKKSIFSVPISAGLIDKKPFVGSGLAFQAQVEETVQITPTFLLQRLFDSNQKYIMSAGMTLRLSNFVFSPQYVYDLGGSSSNFIFIQVSFFI